MSEDTPTYTTVTTCHEREDDAERVMWLALRRGLITIVRAIEERYDVSSDDRRKKAA